MQARRITLVGALMALAITPAEAFQFNGGIMGEGVQTSHNQRAEYLLANRYDERATFRVEVFTQDWQRVPRDELWQSEQEAYSLSTDEEVIVRIRFRPGDARRSYYVCAEVDGGGQRICGRLRLSGVR